MDSRYNLYHHCCLLTVFYYDVRGRQICKLMFYSLWQMHLVSLYSNRSPSDIVQVQQITTVYLIWCGFDMKQQRRLWKGEETSERGVIFVNILWWAHLSWVLHCCRFSSCLLRRSSGPIPVHFYSYSSFRYLAFQCHHSSPLHTEACSDFSITQCYSTCFAALIGCRTI